MKACARCGRELDRDLEIFRTTYCPGCRADLHTCTNCTFYQPGAHWDCRETISEEVTDKERGNFCEFFRFNETVRGRKSGGPNRNGAKAKSDFNKLFGD